MLASMQQPLRPKFQQACQRCFDPLGDGPVVKVSLLGWIHQRCDTRHCFQFEYVCHKKEYKELWRICPPGDTGRGRKKLFRLLCPDLVFDHRSTKMWSRFVPRLLAYTRKLIHLDFRNLMNAIREVEEAAKEN